MEQEFCEEFAKLINNNMSTLYTHTIVDTSLLAKLVQGQILTSHNKDDINAVPEERAQDRADKLYKYLKNNCLEKNEVKKLVDILTTCKQVQPAKIIQKCLAQESPQERNTSEEDVTRSDDDEDGIEMSLIQNSTQSSFQEDTNIALEQTGADPPESTREPFQNNADTMNPFQRLRRFMGEHRIVSVAAVLVIAALLVIAAVLLTIFVLTKPATATGPKVEDPESEQCTNARQINIDGPWVLLSDFENLTRVNLTLTPSMKVNWSKWKLENSEAVCGITMDGFLSTKDILYILKKFQNVRTATFKLGGELCSNISRNEIIEDSLLLKSLYKVGYNVTGASCNEFFRFAAEQLILPNLSEILFENVLIVRGNVDNIQKIFDSRQSNLKYINMYNVTVGKGATLFKDSEFPELLAARITFSEDSNEEAIAECKHYFKSSISEKCKVEIETPRELKVECDA